MVEPQALTATIHHPALTTATAMVSTRRRAPQLTQPPSQLLTEEQKEAILPTKTPTAIKSTCSRKRQATTVATMIGNNQQLSGNVRLKLKN